MSDTDSQARVLRYTARIVAAQASRNTTSPEALVALIKTVHSSLLAAVSPGHGPAAYPSQAAGSRLGAGESGGHGVGHVGGHGRGPRRGSHADGEPIASQALAGGRQAEQGKLVPAVPIKRSIHRDYLISLEDGAKVKMLKRHLATSYGLTPEQYRAKWGLPPDYPMVAPAYAERRSELAKEIGLGRKRKAGAAAASTDDAPSVASPKDAAPGQERHRQEVEEPVDEEPDPAPATAEPEHADEEPGEEERGDEEHDEPRSPTRHTAESVFANFRQPAAGGAEDEDEPEAPAVKVPEGPKRKRFAQQPARRMPRKRTP